MLVVSELTIIVFRFLFYITSDSVVTRELKQAMFLTTRTPTGVNRVVMEGKQNDSDTLPVF
jgi:hypothetical protein